MKALYLFAWVSGGAAVVGAQHLMSGQITTGVLFLVTALVALALVWWVHTFSYDPVDIWYFQRQLMAKSDQMVAEQPSLTPTVILYYALMLEEMGEAAATMAQIITRHRGENDAHRTGTVAETFMAMKRLAAELKEDSLCLRRAAAQLPEDLHYMLNSVQARHLFDDCVDITVVVAGFGLAAGMPMDAGYLEVAESNLSKADPVTGLIKKDPSGKWIKGSNYRPPDLARVLETYADES